MKIKVILLVAVLLCSLCVCVSARSTDISNIENGDTIFVWENGLDLTGVNVTAGANFVSLRKYTDDNREKGVLNIIPVGTPANFDVLNTEVNDLLGIYYLYNTTYGAFPEYVIIKKPAPSLGVVLNSSHSSSVNGESIDSDTKIAFKVMSPLVGTYYKYGSSYPAQAKIEFTTPTGGKTCILNNSDFSRINITKTAFYTDTDTFWGSTNLAGVESGTYSAVMKWVIPEGFRDYASSSSAVTFTAEIPRRISLTSGKTSLIRGNNFVTVISGKSNEQYALFVKNAALSSSDMYPRIVYSQPGINQSYAQLTKDAEFINTIGTEIPSSDGVNFTESIAKVTTKADGTRPVEFYTGPTTDERTFTIIAKSIADHSRYDTVTVKVEAGAVTISASGDGTHYLGEEITLSGTNTDSNTVYLFMTGPNLRTNGVSLTNPTSSVFSPVTKCVTSADTWNYKWDTSGLSLDSGSFTIYSTSQSAEKNELNGIKYDFLPIILKKPYILALTSSSLVTRGDKFTISGNATGDPEYIAIWIFGKNYWFIAISCG